MKNKKRGRGWGARPSSARRAAIIDKFKKGKRGCIADGARRGKGRESGQTMTQEVRRRSHITAYTKKKKCGGGEPDGPGEKEARKKSSRTPYLSGSKE